VFGCPWNIDYYLKIEVILQYKFGNTPI
jgi:hypothetical protein